MAGGSGARQQVSARAQPRTEQEYMTMGRWRKVQVGQGHVCVVVCGVKAGVYNRHVAKGVGWAWAMW